MRTVRLLYLFLAAVVLANAQRHKVSIDPETREGFVLQQIRQERDPAAKLKLMNDFAAEYPASRSISWVLDQLQAAYLEAKDWDKVISVGLRMIEADPDDLEAAHSMLLAAEAQKNDEQLVRFAVLCGKIASHLEKVPGYSRVEYAGQMMSYVEYAVGSLLDSATPDKRVAYKSALEEINKESQWLKAPAREFYALARQGASREAMVQAAERGLAADPRNEDMLMLVADYYMEKGTNRDRVLECANKVLEILKTRERPESLTEAQWETKKAQYTGAAFYMIGVVSSLQGRYSIADRNLRTALPMLRNAPDQVVGAALYHLGYANYQLAEAGERQRVFDAIRFNEQCANTRSTYSEQARKNVDSIRTQYDLK